MKTDATIAGFDATVNYHITERLSLLSKWALIHGQDVRNNIPIVKSKIESQKKNGGGQLFVKYFPLKTARARPFLKPP